MKLKFVLFFYKMKQNDKEKDGNIMHSRFVFVNCFKLSSCQQKEATDEHRVS